MAVERQSSNLPPAQPSYILRGHASQVHSVGFVRQNTRLITGDADGWVIYWKLTTKRALAVWRAHDGAILGTAEWAPGRIITHGRDNNLRIWQLRTVDESAMSTALPADVTPENRPLPWLLHTLPVNTLNFCAFSVCCASVQTKQAESGNVDKRVQPHSDGEVDSILVAVPARDDKKAEVYQFPEERLKYVVPRAQAKDTGMVMAIKLVQDTAACRTFVLTGYEGGLTAVHVLPIDDGSSIGMAQLVYLSQPHTQPILSLDVSPDAQTYFTSGADAIVAAHRIPDSSLRHGAGNQTLSAKDEADDPPISAPSLESAHSSASVSEDTTDDPADDPPVSIPDSDVDDAFSFSKRHIEASAQAKQTSLRPGGLSSLLANPAHSGQAQGVPPRSQPTPSNQAPYKINNTKHAGQQSLSVRSDGRILATGGWDSRIRVYSTKTLKEVAVLRWHKEGVYAVAFAELLGSDSFEASAEQSESGILEGAVKIKETGLSKLQREREEKTQVKHWVAAGAKDGKVSLWEVF